MAKFILRNIVGFANYDEAMDKWSGYFNDCRKKERSANVVRKKFNVWCFLSAFSECYLS